MLLKYRAKSNRKLWWLIYVKNYSGIALDDVIWWELSTDFFFQQINYTLSLRNKRSPFYISLFSSWMRTSADWCCSKNKVQRIVERSILQTINNLTIQRKLGLTLERPAKNCIIVDQPGLVGPLSTFRAKALLYDSCCQCEGSFESLILRINVLKHLC